MVNNLPEMWDTWVQSLEEEMATHSRILAWRIPWIEEPGGLQPTGLQELDTFERPTLNFFKHFLS